MTSSDNIKLGENYEIKITFILIIFRWKQNENTLDWIKRLFKFLKDYRSTTDAWRRPEDTTAKTCEYKQDEHVGSNRKVNNAKIFASEKDIYINNKINSVNFNTDYPDHIVKIYQNLNNYQILKEIYFSF